MKLSHSIHLPKFKVRLSVEEIKSRTSNESVILISNEYVNAHEKLLWQCKLCGHKFHSNWCHISNGSRCPKCKNTNMSIRVKEMRRDRGDGMNLDILISELSYRNIELIDRLPSYVSNLSIKCTLSCGICLSTFKSRISDILRKSTKGCWNCNRPKGNTHWAWRGGDSSKYPNQWNNQLREFIRNRDNRTCQYPRCSYSQLDKSKKLHVHHINGIKDDCRHVNLISLCPKHHVWVEKKDGRDVWQEYFYAITGDYEIMQ